MPLPCACLSSSPLSLQTVAQNLWAKQLEEWYLICCRWLDPNFHPVDLKNVFHTGTGWKSMGRSMQIYHYRRQISQSTVLLTAGQYRHLCIRRATCPQGSRNNTHMNNFLSHTGCVDATWRWRMLPANYHVNLGPWWKCDFLNRYHPNLFTATAFEL